jgi:hypothetical protein
MVYHLDLCVLAYLMHCQSLVWPFDPFYEERKENLTRSERPLLERSVFMGRVRQWALVQGMAQTQAPSGLGEYRGPGALAGFADNADHDPIIYDYSRLHPWSGGIMNAIAFEVGEFGTWTEYLPPKEITRRIRRVFVAYRPVGGAAGDVDVHEVIPGRNDFDADAEDILLAFEGETGGSASKPGSQSLMGCVLVRVVGTTGYDVHIAFRGSRSGDTARAVSEGLQGRGNPDWITDADVTRETFPAVSSVGEVARGFATSVGSTMPRVFACLLKAAELMKAKFGAPTAPKNIYVTGHSLGGALAQGFTSAVLLGAPATNQNAYADLLAWPWPMIKLVSFSAPRMGDDAWAAELTVRQLDSAYWAGTLGFDDNALESTDPRIAPRLLDPTRPVGFRVLISSDAATSGLIGLPLPASAYHAGTSVYVDKACGRLPIPPLFFESPEVPHQPPVIRNLILEAIADARTPPVSFTWPYPAIESFPPARTDSERGTQRGFEGLRDSIAEYYSSRGLYFDELSFRADFDLMLSLE